MGVVGHLRGWVESEEDTRARGGHVLEGCCTPLRHNRRRQINLIHGLV